MAKITSKASKNDDVTPPSLPKTPPHSQPGHDFTLQAVMEMQKSLGQFTAKVDRLIDDVTELKTAMGDVKQSVDRVKTGAIVATAILSIVGIVLWWAIGDRITVAVRSAISSAPIQSPSVAPSPNTK